MAADEPVSTAGRVQILIPVFDDWPAVRRLLEELALVATSAQRRFDVLLVDDGSPTTERFATGLPSGLGTVEVLRLRRNVGHQRAIAIGLAFVEARGELDTPVVVMDGDGEDRPDDVAALLGAADAMGHTHIVFAERTRRSEGWLFSLLYHAYRLTHWVCTGVRVRVGNFSLVPATALRRLVAVSDLWNHYAAAVFKSRIAYTSIPTTRGRRYAGQSRMPLAALLTHGLSAMAAFGDRISVRLLSATLILVVIVVAVGAAAVVRPWLAGDLSGSSALLAALLLLVITFQSIVVALTFVFVILGSRDATRFLPLRDYRDFIMDVERVHTGPA